MSRSLAQAKETRGQLALTALIPRINAHHRAVYHKSKEMVAEDIAAGNLLLKLKELTPHGQFERVINDNPDCDLSLRTARLYMQLARGFPQLEEELGSLAYEMSIEACINKLNQGGKQNGRGLPFCASPSDTSETSQPAQLNGGGDEGEASAKGETADQEEDRAAVGAARTPRPDIDLHHGSQTAEAEVHLQNGKAFHAEAEIKAAVAGVMRVINLLHRHSPNEKLKGECVQSLDCLYEDLRTWSKRAGV